MNDLIFQILSVYLDDILVYSSSFQEHIDWLDVVLGHLREAGLRLKLSKCKFLQKETPYLGHVISKDRIATDPLKTSVVADWPTPKVVKELRSFMSFCSYYRHFVEGFAKIVGVLHELVNHVTSELKVKSKFCPPFSARWLPVHQQDMDTLKEALTSAPVLGYADYSLSFMLETDGSHDGLGAVLSQVQDGKRRVIACASRRLQESEKNPINYSTMKLELLALKWAVTEKFRSYLLGQQFDR